MRSFQHRPLLLAGRSNLWCRPCFADCIRRCSSRSTVSHHPVAPEHSSASSPSVPPLTAEASVSDLLSSTTVEVEETFRRSVEERTVSNLQLQKYIQRLQPKDNALAVAAVKGCKDGGLQINSKTYEGLLLCLMSGGQLRASMQIYQDMVKQHMTPTTATYAALMQLCLQRDMPASCQTLFQDMQKRGIRPSTENYELMIASLSTEIPPNWELAVKIFDKISQERKSRISAKTYTALMRVYLNMRPFDWRVVYNCYSEMRSREPRIVLEWESYLVLREALRKGNAGYCRRLLAYLDAWFAVTPLRSTDFAVGVGVYIVICMIVKTIIGYVLLLIYERKSPATSDSIVPM